MNKMILFKHPVSYAKLKGAFEDVIENFISSSEFDYENQAYWLKKFHRILMGKVITYRNNVDDLDNQMYIEYLDYGFYGKICLYDGIQTKGCVTLTDKTMINGICVVAPKSFKGDEYNESLYKILIKMGNFIKDSLETDNALICYPVDGDTELLDFLGALPIFYFKIKNGLQTKSAF